MGMADSSGMMPAARMPDQLPARFMKWSGVSFQAAACDDEARSHVAATGLRDPSVSGPRPSSAFITGLDRTAQAVSARLVRRTGRSARGEHSRDARIRRGRPGGTGTWIGLGRRSLRGRLGCRLSGTVKKNDAGTADGCGSWKLGRKRLARWVERLMKAARSRRATWPPRRHHDPHRLSARPARRRARQLALGHARLPAGHLHVRTQPADLQIHRRGNGASGYGTMRELSVRSLNQVKSRQVPHRDIQLMRCRVPKLPNYSFLAESLRPVSLVLARNSRWALSQSSAAVHF